MEFLQGLSGAVRGTDIDGPWHLSLAVEANFQRPTDPHIFRP